MPSCSVLGTGLYSQASKHAEFGGVFPNLAKREHQLNLVPMLTLALQNAGGNIKYQITNEKHDASTFDILSSILDREPELLIQLKQYFTEHPENPGFDAIAVTQGPGLEPALWVGISFAKALSFFWNIPLVPVNHMEGHILSVLMNGEKNPKSEIRNPKIEFPTVALLVSGGHTELVCVRDWGTYELIGQTRDDAVGEAFDKVARLLGLPYPGGPQISALAEISRTNAQKTQINTNTNSRVSASDSRTSAIHLPRPMINSEDFDFSFAGLKTAVLYTVKKIGELSDDQKKEIAREFEDAAIEVLVAKTKKALELYNAPTLIIGGGVVANTYLRDEMKKMLAQEFPDVTLLLPTHELSTDNAVMIGIAGYIAYTKNSNGYGVFLPAHDTLRAHGTLRLHNE
ncbi:tRNA (adenosine(37)-N6)-threonylcarbamoyltransferase complex transferase subunit TsaD [Candidatus Campbellbacteria bacterium]|nr:MAG: tRNA (adenosine(37)-N6)-threonylcarbamoyltransferase complex transferase subunit TsaD [Candidatus Campbellbacteria bacterium]